MSGLPPQGPQTQPQQTPQVTVQHIKMLLRAPAERPVLYVKDDPDAGGLELDVWASAYVPHSSIVITKADAADWLGSNPSARTIKEYLPELQEDVDAIVAKMTDDELST